MLGISIIMVLTDLTHTSTLRDILGPHNALGFSCGTRLTGQLTLHVLIGSRRTLDTPVLLTTVECPYTTADWEIHSTVIRCSGVVDGTFINLLVFKNNLDY